MNAVLDMPSNDGLRYEPMSADNLDLVLAIENDVFPYPWGSKAYEDSLQAEGYVCRVAYDADGLLVGYFVLMQVVDEAHLLNIAVCGRLHGHGLGRKLLDRAIEMARDDMGVESLLLEVRPSNQRAFMLYERYGFKEIGRRPNYYQASNTTREDAIVMRLPL